MMARIESGFVDIDLPFVEPGMSIVATGIIPGVRFGDVVILSPPISISSGLVYQGAEVVNFDIIAVRMRNESLGTINEPVRKYAYVWIAR